nr:IS30 family transposase [Kribbella turkmenica]
MTGPADAVTSDLISDRSLCLDQRLAIADGLINKLTLTAIAAGIGKHKSTVCREVRAHSTDGLYLPHQAHRDAAAARARPKTCKLMTDTALREQVEQGLERKLSPEQISNRLVKDFPDDESMRVSHETIYQALYFQARGGLKREVQAALRTGRTRRKPQRQPDQRRHRFDEMIMISERPAEADDRAVPGHWEGDLIMGEHNRSAIGTLVERATRYTMLVHLPGGHDAEQVRDGLIQTMQTLPDHLRGSLTWDQGSEMARHKQFSIATDIAVYFCDPHSPWQRGTNENTNGLLRQYFPKGTDLSAYGPEDLEHVAQELNARPRKTLSWDTPAERLRDLLTT